MPEPKSNKRDELWGEDIGDEDKKLAENLPDSPEVIVEKVKLERSITLFGAVAILITNIGGAGVFIAPTLILQFSGSPGMSIIIWLLGGIMQAAVAFCTVEVALMFNKAGGPYYYINYTFGDMAGFVFMWSFLLFIAGPSWALGSYTASLYTLSIFYTTCPPPVFLIRLVAFWLIVTLVALNCTYMKVITSTQSFLTLCKVIALVIIISFGIAFVPSEMGQENLSVFFEGTTTSIGNLAMGLFAGFFGYGGWQLITIVGEEIKDPVRTVPRALTLSFTLIILIMIATNFAYYVVLSKAEALKSDAVAMLFGEMIHPVLPVVLSVLVSLCAIGTLNVLIMGQPRMMFAAGRNGHMPRIMTMLHKKYHTPWPATWTVGVVATGMLANGSVSSLVSSIALFSSIMTISLILCLLCLRWKQPDTYRPLKVPIFIPLLTSSIMLAVLVVSIIAEPAALVTNLVVIFLGIPVYIIFFKCDAVKKHLTFMDAFGFYLERLFSLQYES